MVRSVWFCEQKCVHCSTVRIKVKFLGPVHQHLLLNSPFISRSPTGCGALAHLTPCQTPPVRVPLPIYPRPPLSFSARMDVFCCHPANLRPILSSVFSPSFSLWASVLLFSPRHHHSFPSTLPPSHRLGSKTGAGSWEAINQQKLCVGALLRNKTTADSFTH